MFGFWKTWKALEAKGIMGINRRNADYVLKYNKRSLYPIVDDKIITKERAIKAGIHVPEMYGVISTEKEIEKLDDIIGDRSDFVIFGCRSGSRARNPLPDLHPGAPGGAVVVGFKQRAGALPCLAGGGPLHVGVVHEGQQDH